MFERLESDLTLEWEMHLPTIVRRGICMRSINVEVNYQAKASRLELFIRFIWGMLVFISLAIIGIFASMAICIQWFYILVFGKRHKGLHSFVTAWLCAVVGMMMYNNLSTDERPPFIPKF